MVSEWRTAGRLEAPPVDMAFGAEDGVGLPGDRTRDHVNSRDSRA